jgi:archaellum component FlaF (FlaF/FlaG flagellin family)
MESPFVGLLIFLLILVVGANLFASSLAGFNRVKISVESHFDSNSDILAKMNIISIDCDLNGSIGSVNLSILNNGSKKLHLDDLSFYVDSLRVNRSDNSRNLTLNSTLNIIDSLLWNPDEILDVELKNLSLNDNQSYYFVVVNGYDYKEGIFCAP